MEPSSSALTRAKRPGLCTGDGHFLHRRRHAHVGGKSLLTGSPSSPPWKPAQQPRRPPAKLNTAAAQRPRPSGRAHDAKARGSRPETPSWSLRRRRRRRLMPSLLPLAPRPTQRYGYVPSRGQYTLHSVVGSKTWTTWLFFFFLPRALVDTLRVVRTIIRPKTRSSPVFRQSILCVSTFIRPEACLPRR